MKLGSVFHTVSKRFTKQRMLLRAMIALLITIGIFAVVFMFIDPADVLDSLKKVSLWGILLGFLFYLLSTTFRAARFYFMYRSVSFHTFFSIVSIHTFLTNVLPARSGELAFPVLLKKVDGSPVVSSLALLFVARIMDLTAVFLLFFVALAFVFNSLDANLVTPMILIGLAFFVLLIGFIFILVWGKKTLEVCRKFLIFDWLRYNKVTDFVFDKLHLLVDGMAVVKKTHSFLIVLFLSICIWSANYMTTWAIVSSMGFDLEFWILIMGFTFSTLVSALPIHGLGSFGTLEGAWVLIFLSFGATKEMALATGLAFHIFLLLYLMIFCVFGVVHLMVLKKSDAHSQGDGEGGEYD